MGITLNTAPPVDQRYSRRHAFQTRKQPFGMPVPKLHWLPIVIDFQEGPFLFRAYSLGGVSHDPENSPALRLGLHNGTAFMDCIRNRAIPNAGK
ncbi:MAG: hypothetical protein ACYCYP_01060 [Leptospirales bacterium]